MRSEVVQLHRLLRRQPAAEVRQKSDRSQKEVSHDEVGDSLPAAASSGSAEPGNVTGETFAQCGALTGASRESDGTSRAGVSALPRLAEVGNMTVETFAEGDAVQEPRKAKHRRQACWIQQQVIPAGESTVKVPMLRNRL